MLLDWHLANLEYANATLLSNLSMAFWDQDDPYEMGGDHCFIPGGNYHFVRALAENLPIFYDRIVTRIQYGSDGVMVYANGQVFRGDMALCTVPLGVLKKACIEFVPELPPQKQEAIKRLGFGLLNKVAMLFPYDFWNGEIDTFGHLTENSSLRGEFFLFYSYSSVSGGPLLVALVAGESAINFELISPVVHVERVLEVLRGIFGPKGIEVPKPIQAICTRWGSDKFAYGSYSYVAVGSSGDDYDVLAESVGDERVFFAGEATNRRYPATMHGALLSGFREAANIARAAKRRSLVPVMERVEAKEEVLDLDDLFRTPDLSFGNFSVLNDPCSSGCDSTSLVRVGIGERKPGSGSLFLYGLISRKRITEMLQSILSFLELAAEIISAMILGGTMAQRCKIEGFLFRMLGHFTGQSLLGAKVVASMLMFATVAGILMALFLNTAGGAWDNAKKYIETGALGGKGSDCHKAAVTGDTTNLMPNHPTCDVRWV